LGNSVGTVVVDGLSKATGFSNTEEGAALSGGITIMEGLSNETGISKIDVG
jgi:hypothetical protein